MGPDRSRRSAPFGARGAVLLGLLGCGVLAYLWLDLSWSGLVPHAGGLDIAREFFGRAWSPAWTSEAEFVPPGTPPLPLLALQAVLRTLVLATIATSLSVVVGLALGVVASSSWWRRGTDPHVWYAPIVYGALRTLIALMRSVHELLWAVLFLAAFGLTEVAAVIAIAIPYGGTLAKIYSELLDEAPTDSGDALRAAGATGLQMFCFGVLPRALPDMAAYTFYRFECALRASAVLGFFGIPTIGLYIRQSFLSSNYGEVWTFLYALLLLVVAFDAWSRVLRGRLVA